MHIICVGLHADSGIRRCKVCALRYVLCNLYCKWYLHNEIIQWFTQKYNVDSLLQVYWLHKYENKSRLFRWEILKEPSHHELSHRSHYMSRMTFLDVYFTRGQTNAWGGFQRTSVLAALKTFIFLVWGLFGFLKFGI